MVKSYILTTDNFGDNSGIRGAGLLWESEDGRFSCFLMPK